MKTLLTIILLAFTVNAHADFALWGSANLFGGASGALPPSGTTLADSLNGTTTGTFARNSLAWNPDTGAEVAINTPVYVAGKSSLGALIQPSSTNKTTSYSVPRADSLGSELNTGNLTTGTGYTVTNNDATHTVTFGAGGARYVADTSTPALNIAVNTILTPGVQYKAVIDVTVASGSVKIAGGVTTSSIPLVNGTNTVYFIANGGSLAFNRANVPVDTTFTSISIKASTDNTGISAFYSDTAAAFHNPIPNMTLSGDTAAVLSIVNDQAAIDAAIAAELVTPTGMLPALQAAKANGYKVYKLDNSLGSSNAFVNLAGDTSSTNQYYFTPVLRATSGSIKLRMSASNFTPVPTRHKY
jgi:hypothetical protein